ncbi:response regulator transcription factor [Rhizohabitans arisaemae]|uniref:response regulator transcription factor n=1 Tax=Rhizohabitans arisaemae TaxID=2720610 RepID=UPI0024B12D55|nr:response regulator transcription factor [Rhizohabitans arisaemae]
MTRVLVVDDEPQILRALRINLAARRYEVAVARDGADALRQADAWHPDLVLLDLGLPDVAGTQVIRGLRARLAVPIIVLSGRVGSRDKVEALDAGADDYITKPFAVDELFARIRAVTRRGGRHTTETRIGEHIVDFVRRTVSGGVRLTPTEWRLLEVLSRDPGTLIAHDRLLTEVWGQAWVGQTGHLRQYMARLRRKLEPDPAHPRHLLTEPGMGYRFQQQ